MSSAMTVVGWATGGLAVLAGLWVVVLLVRDRLPGDPLFALLAVIELGLLVELGLGIARVAGGAGATSVVTYLGYLVASLVILPAAVFWSLAERSRGGTAVLLVGALLVPFLLYRVSEIWVG